MELPADFLSLGRGSVIHGSSQKRKDMGHHALVGDFDILHIKRHHVVAIHPYWSYECLVF